jgi:DnaK suppressor protein
MDKELLLQIKENLVKEKERLEKELLSIADKKEVVADDFDSRFPNWGDDIDSNAAEVNNYSSRLGIEKNLESLLQATSQALDKIDNDTYGVCEQCGQEIQLERLKAFPAATFCMKCQGDKS